MAESVVTPACDSLADFRSLCQRVLETSSQEFLNISLSVALDAQQYDIEVPGNVKIIAGVSSTT